MLTIAESGNSILKRKAETIEDCQDPELQGFIDDLIATALEANGVGIAAPQVFRSIRLFIVASRPNPRYPSAPVMEPVAMINPRIIEVSGEIGKGWEGCLSVPGKRGLVPRHSWVEVEYLDRGGNLRRRRLTDFVARIFQHELDHLDGILFIDRLESEADLYTEEQYRGMIEKSTVT